MTKLLLSLLFIAFHLPGICQPSVADVKKYKIKKVVEDVTEYGSTRQSFWYYTQDGYERLKNYFADTVPVTHTFKNGKVIQKVVVKPGNKKDIYEYAYNPDGSYKVTYTDGGYGMKSYEWYDAKDKISKTQSPDGNTITYKYDAKGRLLNVVSDGQNDGIKINHQYKYNAKGQLATVIRNVDGNKTEVTYQYNNKNQCIKETSKGLSHGEQASSSINYTYNTKGLISKIEAKYGDVTSVKVYTYEYY